MALTPQKQLKQLLVGTSGAILSILAISLTAHWENQIIFYGLTLTFAASIIYALPGYLGIWLWRMRKFFFDIN